MEAYFWNDELFYDLSELEERLEDLKEERDITEEDFPIEITLAKIQHPRKINAAEIAQDLLDDYLHDLGKSQGMPRTWYYVYTSAYNIAYKWLEHFYCNCEDIDTIEDVRGIDDLQWAIDWFLFWNTGFFRYFAECRWFKPGNHTIGINVLQDALDIFRAKNTHHFVYVESKQRFYVDKDFNLTSASKRRSH